MPASNTNEKLLQPNPYAGGRPAQPISMPLSQSNPPGTGGNSSNGNQGPGQNDMTVDGDVSLSGPSTGLNGTPQTNPPYPGGNVQPTNPDSGLTNTVPGMVPGTNGVNGPGQGPSSGNATGWRKVGNDWYYFDPSNEAMVKGWKMVNGLWYYLDFITGIMAKSWIFVGELWYYLEPSAGHMLLGWNYINEEWYYLETTNGNGQMVTGWKEDGEKWYFLFETGAMAHGGWLLIDGTWYCVQDNGEMEAEKILLFEGKKYYVGKDGAMVTKATLPQPEITCDGITYDVAEDGVCTENENLQNKIEKWMVSVESIGTWYVENVTTYLEGGKVNGYSTRKYYECPLIAQRVGDDCSSMVSGCLVLAKIIPSVGYYNSYSYNKDDEDKNVKLIQALENAGFVWHTYDLHYIPRRGDISVQHKGEDTAHVEVIASYNIDSGSTAIWSWGKVYKSLPSSRNKAGWQAKVSGYWRIEQ